MQKPTSSRDPALDVIRIFALFGVIAAHFLLNGGYYSVYIVGGRLYLATVLRNFFVTCVPLFLMLSGYLMHKKTPCRAYYAKLSRILGEYVLACVLCMAYRALRQGGTAAQMLGYFALQIPGILSFDVAGYGWYVNMYLGLFLLIPYLNGMYNALEGRKQKQGLVLTLLFLSCLPDTLKCICFRLPWTLPYNDPAGGLTLLPDWWSFLYPVAYYFLGAYLREYPLKLSRWKTAGVLLAFMLLAGTVSYLLNAGKEHLYAPWQDNQSLLIGIQAVLVFHFLSGLDLKGLGSGTKRLLACLSDLTFCAYLVSWVFDDYFYALFQREGGLLIHRPQYFFVLVPLVLVCSFAAAFLLVSLYKAIAKRLHRQRSTV